MAITLLRRFRPLLLSGAVGFGMATPSNAAEELRIGFWPRPQASLPRSARTWSMASKCTSTT